MSLTPEFTPEEQMIRRALIAVAACAFLVGCGDDDATTSPSAAPMVFYGHPQSSQRSPPGRQRRIGRPRRRADHDHRLTADVYFQVHGFPATPGFRAPTSTRRGAASTGPSPSARRSLPGRRCPCRTESWSITSPGSRLCGDTGGTHYNAAATTSTCTRHSTRADSREGN